MFKTKWSTCVLAFLMEMSFIVTGNVLATEPCSDANTGAFPSLQKLVQSIQPIVQSIQPAPMSCTPENTKSATIGFKCKTSKGATFERVSRNNFGEAWKGPDGLIWSDSVGYTANNVVDKCKNIGGDLPSRAIFERGEANGFREVLPNMQNRVYWSSPANPNVPDYSYCLNRFCDYLEFVRRNHQLFSVRCVGQ